MKAGIVFLFLLLSAGLLLGGCGSSTPLTEVTGPVEGPGNGGGNGEPPPPEPTPISEITDEEAILLARSVMAMTGGLAAIGEITTDMIRKGSGLLSNPDRVPGDAIPLPECNDEFESGPGTNQLSYVINSGQGELPAGEALRVEFRECTIRQLVVDGVLDITTISSVGNPASDVDNWSFSSQVYLSRPDLLHPNGTMTSYRDRISYTASKSNNVLTVDIEISADPDTGMIGGLNAQHHLTQVYNNNTAINYQFRPFRITTVVDDDAGDYRVIIQPHSTDGDSRLERYTTTPPGEIAVTVATAGLLPIIWADGKPQSYLEPPASGKVSLVDGNRSLVATVDGDAVTLTLTVDGAVTADTIPWAELLTAPES